MVRLCRTARFDHKRKNEIARLRRNRFFEQLSGNDRNRVWATYTSFQGAAYYLRGISKVEVEDQEGTVVSAIGTGCPSIQLKFAKGSKGQYRALVVVMSKCG